MTLPHLILHCWYCHEELEERDSVVVRTNPHLPEWMGKSVTRVHPECAEAHLEVS